MCHTLGNARPTTEHIQNCSRNFSQVTASQKKILAVGSAAVEGILRTYGPEHITKTSLSMSKLLTNGQPLRLSGGKWLFITYHPSYLLRNQSANPAFPEYQIILNEIKAAYDWNKEFEINNEDSTAMYNQTSFF
jgi:uracil-DNA glycosylase